MPRSTCLASGVRGPESKNSTPDPRHVGLIASGTHPRVLRFIENTHLDGRAFFWQNGVSERNTVQPQAVNLAYAEPCQIQARLFFFLWAPPACGQNGLATQRLRQRGRPISLFSVINSCPVFFLETRRPRPKPAGARTHTSSAPHPRADTRGPRPFEGAQLVRRCSPFSKSEHLGKPRRFLRRCAPFFEGAHEKCAPSADRCGAADGKICDSKNFPEKIGANRGPFSA
jgi:hypothetical protein